MTSATVTRRSAIALALAGVTSAAVLSPEIAAAGSGGSEFDSIWQTLTGWVRGRLGQIIVLAMVIVGIVGGVARQSIMAFAIGVGAGLGLYASPTIVEQIVSASAASIDAVTAAPAAVADVVRDATSASPR